MRSSQPKKHHYVPQFILNNFSLGENKRIYVFDKKVVKIFPSHVRDTGHENNFYKEESVKYDIDTESKLAELESTSAPVIRKIIKNESVDNLSASEFNILCLFSAVQLSRTNNSREMFTSINNKISEWLKKSGINSDQIEGFTEQSKEEIKESAIHYLRTTPGDYVKHFYDKELTLLKTPKGETFYISDHPVTIYNHFPREHRGNLGIALKGIEIYFPISSKLSLSFLCADTINKTRKAVLAQKVSQALGGGFPIEMSEPEKFLYNIDNKITRVLKEENVIFQNSLQISQSSRFIYSSNKKFDLAKDMLKTNPELSMPHNFQ